MTPEVAATRPAPAPSPEDLYRVACEVLEAAKTAQAAARTPLQRLQADDAVVTAEAGKARAAEARAAGPRAAASDEFAQLEADDEQDAIRLVADVIKAAEPTLARMRDRFERRQALGQRLQRGVTVRHVEALAAVRAKLLGLE